MDGGREGVRVRWKGVELEYTDGCHRLMNGSSANEYRK